MMIPIVTGMFGTVPKNLQKGLEELEIGVNPPQKKTANDGVKNIQNEK